MDFIIETMTGFIENLKDWPDGTICSVLILAVCLMLLGLALWGLFIVIDSWFLPRKKSLGRVVGKKFTPAHSETTWHYNAASKTTTPVTIFHDDDWSLFVEVNGLKDDISVVENFYNSVSEGSKVMTEFVIGRLSGGLYLKGICRA